MIAVTFALPQESCDFIHALHHSGPAGAFVLGNLGVEEIVVAHTGIGRSAAEKTVRALLAAHRPRKLFAAGFAGALDPQLAIGDIVERDLVTRDEPVATPEGKAQLARETGARAVDMETSAIAVVCAEQGVPLHIVRAISDTAQAPLPIPFAVSYDLAAQRPRPLAVLRYVLDRPPSAIALGLFLRDLAKARTALTTRLLELCRTDTPPESPH
jgi:nucleoside phosphorylase